ncbi:MAG: pilin [Proteobacteria bacterium]|nr:pilin [Pseudomonadota bacterium]
MFSEKKIGLTDQAKVLQGLSSAIAYKTAVRRYWEENRTLPGTEDWHKRKQKVLVDLTKSIVESIQVGEDGPGVISVLYAASQDLESSAEIHGKKINLIPEVQGGKLIWTCLGTLPLKLLPKRCSKLATVSVAEAKTFKGVEGATSPDDGAN